MKFAKYIHNFKFPEDLFLPQRTTTSKVIPPYPPYPFRADSVVWFLVCLYHSKVSFLRDLELERKRARRRYPYTMNEPSTSWLQESKATAYQSWSSARKSRSQMIEESYSRKWQHVDESSTRNQRLARNPHNDFGHCRSLNRS
jgi:hypothetical protein